VSLNFRYGLMLHFKVFSSTGKSWSHDMYIRYIVQKYIYLDVP
jgi:hypothetical protein